VKFLKNKSIRPDVCNIRYAICEQKGGAAQSGRRDPPFSRGLDTVETAVNQKIAGTISCFSGNGFDMACENR
jgi:hypothetical protein